MVQNTTMQVQSAITVAHGDGIGPEIMAATLRVLREAGAQLGIHTIQVGESVYKSGHTSGIPSEAWDILRATKVFLKAPITTPQGGGYKSLNVTIRKTLGLYANVRPCVSYDPIVPSLRKGMNLVIVRENEEDLYAGIEHRQTEDTVQCLKLVTRPGCERIIRYAFEYARVNGRKKVSCMTKDNIMKLSDGLFHKIFDQIGAEYPEIEKDHWIIDIGMARAGTKPELFDVIVTLNLYGDILSDITAEVAGSVGLAGSANIGESCAMFEAIHGSAPLIAGKGIANPSGLLLSAVQMLIHLNQTEVAERIHNAWLRTLEDGIHTGDIARPEITKQQVGTEDFASAVIARLGQEPTLFPPVRVNHDPSDSMKLTPPVRGSSSRREIVGVDLFVRWLGSADELGAKVSVLGSGSLQLQVITCRGVKVYPDGMPETLLTDHFRCRFMSSTPIGHGDIVALQQRAVDAGVDFLKTEHLVTFDGEPGYSLGQGQ